MNYLLFNPLANNGQGTEMKDKALPEIKKYYAEFVEVSVLELNTDEFIAHLLPEDVIILIGGDGTLNHFANAIYTHHLANKMYLYRAGTGNDFLRDIQSEEVLTELNPYLEKLPKVVINGEETYFINGIGYGIDGMVCEIADGMKEKGIKDINYTSISIKLLLFKYKCPNATVLVDGKEYHYKRVWFASSMNGKYYGGGMMVAPTQDRLQNKLSFVVMYKTRKLRTLIIFPRIFKGEHLKTKHCHLIEGKKIEVKFDRPMALQIDGEVVKNVTSYVAYVE